MLPELPPDILYCIIDVAASLRDRETLLTLALINRECCSYADRYIWHTISLTPRASNPRIFPRSTARATDALTTPNSNSDFVAPMSLRSACLAIMRVPSRARHVRNLSMTFKHNYDIMISMAADGTGLVESPDGSLLVPMSEQAERGLEYLFDCVAGAVAACRDGLETLDVFGPHHLGELGRALGKLVDEKGRGPISFEEASAFRFSEPPPVVEASVSSSPSSTIAPHSITPVLFPRLRTLRTMLAAKHGIMPFLTLACPNITRWEISGRGALACMEDIPSVPEGFFPRLEAFSGVSIGLGNVMRDRPVKELGIINGLDTMPLPGIGTGNGVGEGEGWNWNSEIQELLDALKMGRADAPVLELSLNATIHGLITALGAAGTSDVLITDSHLVRSLAQSAPHLRKLELFTHGQYTDLHYSAYARKHLARDGLGAFGELREFRWWDRRGERWGREFVSACFGSCVSLERMWINKTEYVRAEFETENGGEERMDDAVFDLLMG